MVSSGDSMNNVNDSTNKETTRKRTSRSRHTDVALNQLEKRGILPKQNEEGKLVLKPIEPEPPTPTSIHDKVNSAVEQALINPEQQQQVVNSITNYRRAREHFAGLSEKQRKFILNRALCETDSEACKLAGVNYPTFASWRRNNAIFAKAYAMLWVDPADVAEGMLTTLLPKATSVLEEMLGSSKERAKAVQLIFQSRGLLKQSGGEGPTDVEVALARQLAARGIPLPPALQGYVDIINNTDTNIVDGEVRELEG